jgi:hypothetical protein
MTDREPLVLRKRLPLLEADLYTNAVEFAPHRHRHARQAMMDLVFEIKSPDHLSSSPMPISYAKALCALTRQYCTIARCASPLDLNASMNDARSQAAGVVKV